MSGNNARPGADRRTFIGSAALGLFTFQIAGCGKLLSPRSARLQGAAIDHFAPDEADILSWFGETLVPGARQAGIVHYIDANLGRSPGESLLTARYLDILPPYSEFYRAGLTSLDAYAIRQFGKGFVEATAAEKDALIAPMLGGKVPGWRGPPAPLFYLAVRSDAVDLVYGTRAAFERMNVPYVAHIDPPSDW